MTMSTSSLSPTAIAMSNPSKKKGTAAETKVVKYLTAHGLFAERRALSGSKDNGDIKLVDADGEEYTLEVKAGKQTENYNRAQFEEWFRQAIEEGANSGCKAALVIVRYRRSIEDAEVYCPSPCGIVKTYLDSFSKILSE